MSTFHTTTLDRPILDPMKRVRYSTGLVLGVDEFEQEQAYFMERDRLHQRALHGYGTVHGLEVTVRDSAAGPEVVVAPGLAVDPHGRNICVPSAQCARLNEWLNRNREQVDGELASPPEALELYVVLCHRECDTDEVPVPGGPCRSDEETRTASRVRDHFELQLLFEPPPHVEETAVRRLGRLLRRIRISADELGASLADLLDALGEPAEDGSPPEDDVLYLHPDTAPAILEALQRAWVTRFRPQFLHADRCGSAADGDDCVVLALIRFDIEEVDEHLQVVVGDDDGVEVDETNRPFLLTTRVLQEWLTAWYQGWDFKSALDTFATLFLLDDHTIRAWIHHPDELSFDAEAVTVEVDEDELGNPTSVSQPISGVNVFDLDLADSPPVALARASRITVRFDPSAMETTGSPPEVLADVLDGSFRGYIDRVSGELVAYLFVDGGGAAAMALSDLTDVDAESPADGDVLAWDEEAGMWVPQALAEGGITRHADLTGLDEDDHPQYLLTDGSRALGGDWSAGGNRIQSLAAGQADGDAVPFEQAIKQNDPAGGDLSGQYPNPAVRRLQGRPVRDVQPSPNDALVWDGSQWTPAQISGGESGFEQDLTRIVAGNWRHGETTTLRVLLLEEDRERLVAGIVVAFGKERLGDGGTVFVGQGSLDEGSFRVFVEEEQLGQLPNTWLPVYFRPVDILPVRVQDMQEDQWVVEALPPSDGLVESDAALFLLPLEQAERLLERRIHVQVLGDFVLDETRERVIDVRHLFGRLPTGRPDRGLPGGLFESWAIVGRR